MDIELVIKIPEELYKTIKKSADIYKEDVEDVVLSIIGSTPLPKGHGRLIDADKLKLTQHDIHVEAINYRHRCISIENIDEAPTVIEADKGKRSKRMTKCEECDYSEIVNWEYDSKTGKATPEYWCERKFTLCDYIQDCPYEPLDDEEDEE